MNSNKNQINTNASYERVRKSDFSEKLKIELLVVLGRMYEEGHEIINDFMGYVESHPQVKEWLKSATVIGLLLEVVPISRFGIAVMPGFVPGALVGYLKGAATQTQVRSTIVGGIAGWPLKPILILSPLIGLLLTAFAAGYLEEMLENAMEVANQRLSEASKAV